MRSETEHKDSFENPSYRELRLLSEVDRRPEASQRSLSRKIGTALGLTNLLLHNLAGKGYIRITQAGWKRWLYTLTPTGFSRKIQLTVAYVHRFLYHYQTVRQTLREEMELLALNEESRIAIYGTGEFAELVYLGLKEMRIEEIEVFSPGSPVGSRFLGMAVHDVTDLNPEEFDRVLVAYLNDSNIGHEMLLEQGVSPYKLVTFFGNHVVEAGL